jgi:hypothetical protein
MAVNVDFVWRHYLHTFFQRDRALWNRAPAAGGPLVRPCANATAMRVYRLFGVMMSQHKYLVAEFAFRKALQRNPQRYPGYQAHGITLLELGLAEKTPQLRRNVLVQAVQQLQKALRAATNFLRRI